MNTNQPTHKQCLRCNDVKEFDAFAKSKSAPFGRTNYCRPCSATMQTEWRNKNKDKYKKYLQSRQELNTAYMRDWRSKNRDKVLTNKRRAYLKKQYKVTPDEYEQMRKSQNYCCYICKRHENELQKTINSKTLLNIDHDHNSGKIRKLLCMPCNIALGKVRDDIEILNNMINYLKEHK